MTFSNVSKTLQKKILNRNMDILISNLLSESIFNFGKWSKGKCRPKLLKKKFLKKIWTFSFQICFQNQFWTSGSGQTEIRVFAYIPFDYFTLGTIGVEVGGSKHSCIESQGIESQGYSGVWLLQEVTHFVIKGHFCRYFLCVF